jgi:hypothetical protein
MTKDVMNMRLFKLELIKLIRFPALVGFAAFCLILNVIVVASGSQRDTIDYLNQVAQKTGVVFGEDYSQRLSALPIPHEDDYPSAWLHDELLSAAEQNFNVFAELNGGAEDKAWLTNSRNTATTFVNGLLGWKYQLLTPVIEEKAENGDGDYVYFAHRTDQIHGMVFGSVGKLLATEASIFFLLIMLWALGYEHMAGSHLVTYSTKIGRKLSLHKIAAALCMGTLFFVLIYAVTYGLTFAINDYSLAFGQNVSAQFHRIYDYTLNRPFITWTSMTIGTYFWGTVAVAYLNALVVAVFAIPFGLMIKHVYVAFCSASALIFLNFLVWVLGLRHGMLNPPWWWVVSLLTPFSQIMSNGMWFSDGAHLMLLPHFEFLYPLISLVVLMPVMAVCVRSYVRKEL